jgi:hypothetical protein
MQQRHKANDATTHNDALMGSLRGYAGGLLFGCATISTARDINDVIKIKQQAQGITT